MLSCLAKALNLTGTILTNKLPRTQIPTSFQDSIYFDLIFCIDVLGNTLTTGCFPTYLHLAWGGEPNRRFILHKDDLEFFYKHFLIGNTVFSDSD